MFRDVFVYCVRVGFFVLFWKCSFWVFFMIFNELRDINYYDNLYFYLLKLNIFKVNILKVNMNLIF